MRLVDQKWHCVVLCAVLFAATSARLAHAQDVAVIGPMTGTSDIVGAQMEIGANAFIEGIDVYDDNCDATSGKSSAEAALTSGAVFLIGLPCVEALDAAALAAQAHTEEVIVIGLGVEVPDITNREKRSNWPVFRLAADASAEAETIAEYIGRNWRNVDFALIDDGTLYGRQFVEDVRFLLEQDNLKPVFIDNYRPLLDNQSGMLRRLQRSGASHVLVGGDAYDVAIMGRGAAQLGINLEFAGGSAFYAPPEDGKLPDGTVFAARDRLSITVKESELSNYAVTTYAALQIAEQAQKYASDRGVALNIAMRALRFDTILGSISFGNDGENTHAWYTVYEVENGEPRPLEGSP